ncbi:MAG: phospholipase [Deltaproteobacteria bacterium]|nr:phospholipase [Deltaproteobacteria bacterium]
MRPILQAGRNAWVVDDVDEAGVLIDGLDYYRAFYAAARAARAYILIAGWQFDRDVALVRGDDLVEVDGPVGFRAFLSHLCEKNPDLEVRILAWDFHAVYAFEREWFEKLFFDLGAHERIVYRTDSCHPVGASHHQKFVVVDGEIGFLGGTDICAHRWDDRRHLPRNPDRTDAGGIAYGPYHEVQAYLRGPAVQRLTELFRERWRSSGGGELRLPSVARPPAAAIRPTISLPTRKAALSRTRGADIVPLHEAIHETRDLFVDAIGAAQRLIYLETQYFTARAVHEALLLRMQDDGRPRPEIVLVLPSRAWARPEALAVGRAQARVITDLVDRAGRTGTRLGVYATAPPGNALPDGGTFIHSKVLCVDDRFLCVASANATNRSMGLDTELNVSWEATEGSPLERAIRRTRVSLLAEHCGLGGERAIRALARPDGLVRFLDGMTADPSARLRRYRPPPADAGLLSLIDPDGSAFDPDRPFVEADLHELVASSSCSLLARLVRLVNRLLVGGEAQPATGR